MSRPLLSDQGLWISPRTTGVIGPTGPTGPSPIATSIPYTPADSNDWPTPPPTNVGGGLDTLASEVTALADSFIQGFPLTWVSNTALSVGAGVCRDGSGTRRFITSGVTPIDLTTVGPAGLDVGALAAGKAYALWVLSGTSGTTVVASLSFTAAGVAAPVGYTTLTRRVGSFMTDPSVARVNFLTQWGDTNNREVLLTYPGFDNVALFSAPIAAVLTAVDFTAYVPPSASMVFLQLILLANASAGPQSVSWGPTLSTITTNGNQRSLTITQPSYESNALDWVALDVNKQIRYVGSAPLGDPLLADLGVCAEGYREVL